MNELLQLKKQPSRFEQPFWFIVVGASAAGVHMGAVIMLVNYFSLQPLVANVFGWLIAFVVSFAGQRALTFRATHAPLARSMRRFFVISAGGFVINELTYALLLKYGGLRFDVTLFIVLLVVAGFTFLLSRYWAFAGNAAPR